MEYNGSNDEYHIKLFNEFTKNWTFFGSIKYLIFVMLNFKEIYVYAKLTRDGFYTGDSKDTEQFFLINGRRIFDREHHRLFLFETST